VNAARLHRIGTLWAAMVGLAAVVIWFSGVFCRVVVPAIGHEPAAQLVQVDSVEDAVCTDSTECPADDAPVNPAESESETDIDDDDEPDRMVAVISALAVQAPEGSIRIREREPALEASRCRLPRPAERV